MKKRIPYLLLFCVFLLNSCGIEKRHYRSGFYIPEHSTVKAKQQHEEMIDSSLVVCERTMPNSKDSITVKAENGVEKETDHTDPATTSFSAAQHVVKRIVPALANAQKEIRKEQKIKRRGSGLETQDIVGLIGGGVLVTGIICAVLATTTFKAIPIVAQAFLVTGVALVVIGYILLVIAYPEILLELMVDLIFAALGA